MNVHASAFGMFTQHQMLEGSIFAPSPSTSRGWAPTKTPTWGGGVAHEGSNGGDRTTPNNSCRKLRPPMRPPLGYSTVSRAARVGSAALAGGDMWHERGSGGGEGLIMLAAGF